jgi:membrane protease YdiL (CAAX protease family)
VFVKIGKLLIAAFLAGVLALQFIYLVEYFNPEIYINYGLQLNYLTSAFSMVLVLLVFFLLCVENERLDNFNVDRYSILTLILFSFLWLTLGLSFMIIIGLALSSVVIVLIAKRPQIQRTNRNWTLAGILGSILLIIVIITFELLLRGNWSVPRLLQNNLIVTVVINIAKQLVFISLPEELLFRGFIWGYLRSKGLKEINIAWIQGAVFWLMHFSRLVTPFSFFVIVPIQTLISSLLTLRSKQVFPAVISHTIFNTLGTILNLATF